jgi:hypothetical protein
MRPSVIVRPIAVNPHEIRTTQARQGPHVTPGTPWPPKGINTVLGRQVG